jgi:hypothetical protein
MYIHPDIYSTGLNTVNNGNEIHILTDDPLEDYANIAVFTMGVKTSPTFTSIEDAHPTGKQISLVEITDGEVTASETGTHFALVDTVNEKILLSNSLTEPVDAFLGDDFILTTFSVIISGPTI